MQHTELMYDHTTSSFHISVQIQVILYYGLFPKLHPNARNQLCWMYKHCNMIEFLQNQSQEENKIELILEKVLMHIGILKFTKHHCTVSPFRLNGPSDSFLMSLLNQPKKPKSHLGHGLKLLPKQATSGEVHLDPSH